MLEAFFFFYGVDGIEVVVGIVLKPCLPGHNKKYLFQVVGSCSVTLPQNSMEVN